MTFSSEVVKHGFLDPEQLASHRKAEGNAKYNFGMLKQSLEDQLKVDNKDKNGETTAMTAFLEEKAVDEGDLEMTETSPEDSQAELEDAKQNCMEVALQEAVSEGAPARTGRAHKTKG